VQPLEAPDIHFLNHAHGWLGLDLPQEAVVELNAIAPEFQNHPDVLDARWQLETRLNNWEAGAKRHGPCERDSVLDCVSPLPLFIRMPKSPITQGNRSTLSPNRLQLPKPNPLASYGGKVA